MNDCRCRQRHLHCDVNEERQMLVKCDKCGQSYEIDNSRIPAKGAKMKCPTCRCVLFVQGDGTAVPLDIAPTPESKSADMGLAQGATSEPKLATASQETVWKVRHVGMTYTFHDLEGLQNWLTARSSLDDVKIAKNEDDWRELGDYKEVLTTDMIAKFFPLGDVPTSSSPRPSLSQMNAVEPAASAPIPNVANAAPVAVSNIASPNDEMASYKRSRKAQQKRQKESINEKQKTQRLITIGVVAVVVVLAAIFAWRYFVAGKGVSDVALPSATTVTAAPAPLPAPAAAKAPAQNEAKPAPTEAGKPDSNAAAQGGIDVDDVEAEAEFELQKQIYEAEELVAKKMWPEARAMLESLRKDMPEQIDVLRLLSQTYKGLGLDDKAAKLDAQIAKLKRQQNAD